jgi:hypothetical protein
MSKKILIYLLVLHLVSVHSFAEEIQVPFTNRFFTAKTASGSCFVFIHRDGFTFVSGAQGNRNTVNLKYPPDAINSISDAFITGNYFFMKVGKTLNCYDLAKLTDKSNNGGNFDNIRRLRIYDNEINNIGSISLYEDTFYYTKENDNRVYRFSAVENKVNMAIPNISINRPQDIKQVIYVPMDEKRNREYRDLKTEIDKIIATHKTIGNSPQDKTGIEGAVLSPQTQRTTDGVYIKIRGYLANQYKYDHNIFSEFKSLAKIADTLDDANNSIDTLKTVIPSLPSNILTDFYKANSDYMLYSSDGELQRQRREITNKIKTAEESITRVWGNNYENKKHIFDSSKTNEYRWIDNSGVFSANNDKLRKFHKEIDSLLTGSILNIIFDNKEKYEKYQKYGILYDFYTFVADAYIEKQKTGYKNPNVLSEINKMGLNIYKIQESLFNDSSINFKNIYNKLAGLKKEYTTIENNLKQKADDAIRRRNELLTPIIKYSTARYRNELCDTIKKIAPVGLGDYNAAFMNYCFVSNNDKRISGFGITDQINMNDFSDNRNDAGERYIFIRPLDYPLLSIAKDAVFVLTSKRSIAAFDITRANMRETNIKPLPINEGIFYIIKNENDLRNSQYLVTNDGKLLKLSIGGEEIQTQRIGGNLTLTGNDTVLVTNDTVYIFSSTGTLKMGSPESIKIKSCNSEDIYTIGLRNQQFIVK